MVGSPSRPIDENVSALQHSLKNRFAYVSKARANIWLTTGVTLFLFGLVFSTVVVGRNASTPDYASAPRGTFLTTGPGMEGPTQVAPAIDNGFVFDAAGAVGSNIRYMVDWGDGGAVVDATSANTSKLTLTHTYARVGSFTITVKAAFAGTDGFSVPSTRAITVTASQRAALNLLAAAIDASTPASHKVKAAQVDVLFTSIQFSASSQSDVTLKSLSVAAPLGDPVTTFGKVTIYSGGVAVGTGVFAPGETDGAAQAVVSLGAGLTIPGGNATTLQIKADVLPGAPGGNFALGVAGLTSEPNSSVLDLPLYGKAMLIVAQ